MSKVLVVGHSPLPYENLQKAYAPGGRTWQLARPLIEDGHEVVVLAGRIPHVYPPGTDAVLTSEEQGCTVHRVEQGMFEAGGFSYELMEEFDPDCVIGACAYPSYVAAMYAGTRPLWADVFGSLLAEAQTKLAVYKDNEFLGHFTRIIEPVINVADRYSTVSRRQMYELIGWLGLAQRLITETFGYDFVTPIPAAIEEFELPSAADPTDGRGEPGDFIVLWSGGYNTWTDVDTLFTGLELAMSRSTKVRFVSTGGSIMGHDEVTYPRFERMARASRFNGRFHLKGWVPKAEALSYYRAADVGISIDAYNYEALLGSRTRLLEWGLAELPAVSTNLCELTETLEDEGLLFTYPVGDPEALAGAILSLEADRERLRATGERLKRFVLDNYSYEATTGALREWVKDPHNSPDFSKRWRTRLEMLQNAKKVFTPPITADSPAMEKIRFYIRSEGVVRTVRRSMKFVGKKESDGEE